MSDREIIEYLLGSIGKSQHIVPCPPDAIHNVSEFCQTYSVYSDGCGRCWGDFLDNRNGGVCAMMTKDAVINLLINLVNECSHDDCPPDADDISIPDCARRECVECWQDFAFNRRKMYKPPKKDDDQ